MSMFSPFGDSDNDPFFGDQMGQVNRLMSDMNSFFAPPMGGFFGPGMRSELMPFGHSMGGFLPFGMPSMNQLSLFQNMGQMNNNPNCHSYSTSTFMSMSNGPDGSPQVYQASSSVRQGPGGIKETKKAVADSRSGVKKMAIGHHIGDRAHILKREQNVRTGSREEEEDFINLDEDDAESFNKEWMLRAKSFGKQRAVGYLPENEDHTSAAGHRGTRAIEPAPVGSSDNSLKVPQGVMNYHPKSRKRQHASSANQPTSEPVQLSKASKTSE